MTSSPTGRSINHAQKCMHSQVVSTALVWYKLPWGDRIDLNLNGSYASSKPNESFSLNRNEYFKTGEKDLRNYYNDSRSNTI